MYLQNSAKSVLSITYKSFYSFTLKQIKTKKTDFRFEIGFLY